MSTKNDMKYSLEHIISKTSGLVSELESEIGHLRMEEFSSIGLIKLGRYTWEKLELADSYYKDLYGIFSYWYFKLKKGKLL